MFKGWIRIAAMSACAFTGTFLLHWLMEWTVHTYNLGDEITEGLLSAAIAGVLVFHICLLGHWRRLRYRQRLEAMLTLNHHVRNALQTIVSYIDGTTAAPATELTDAIARIDWVLRDVEPHLTQHEAERQWMQRLPRRGGCETIPAK